MTHKVAVSAAAFLLAASLSAAVYGSRLPTEHDNCLLLEKTTTTYGQSHTRLYTTCGNFHQSPEDTTEYAQDEIYDITTQGYRIPLLFIFPTTVP